MKCKILLLQILSLFYFVQCDGITIEGVKCREKVCKFLEYCSSFDFTCQSCQKICDKTSHNYEEAVCEKDCQSKYISPIKKSGRRNL